MKQLSILGVVLLLAACEQPAPTASASPSATAQPPASASVAAPGQAEVAERLVGCLSERHETMGANCWSSSISIELVGHVPRVAGNEYGYVFPSLSDVLGLDHRAWFVPELVWVRDRQAAMVGTLTSEKLGLAAAATLVLDEEGRIASLKFWFDQREARDQLGLLPGRPGAKAKRVPVEGPPKIVLKPSTIDVERRGDRLTIRHVLANEVLFDSGAGYRADLAAGRAEPPPARRGTEPIRRAQRVTLLEGLPHPLDAERLAAEKKNKATIEVHGYAFYEEALTLEPWRAEWLTELLSDETGLSPFLYEKKCGGFHPDYAVRWEVEGKRYEALLCFGCGEVKWHAPGAKMTRWDIPRWAAMSMTAAIPD